MKTPLKTIDLNCDMGEMPEAIANGTQEALMRCISSVNIACGGHAGNPEMMRTTMEQALRNGVSIGAHPGYEDPANFGRNEMQLSPEEIANSVHRQILTLENIAKQSGATITHVKAHGALYNQAARDRTIAKAIATGVLRWRSDVVLIGLAGSIMLEEFRAARFPVAAEAFADRRYEPDGTLRSRKLADSLLHNPAEAAEQALRIVGHASVIAAGGVAIPLVAQTICIHGDTPGAVEIAAAVKEILQRAGVHIKSLSANGAQKLC